MKIRLKLIISIVFICSVVITLPCRGQAELVIQSKTAINFQLQGYNGLEDIAIFSGSLSAGGSQRVGTLYQGLVMLIFSGGQQYPLIIGRQPSVVTITNSDQVPPLQSGMKINSCTNCCRALSRLTMVTASPV